METQNREPGDQPVERWRRAALLLTVLLYPAGFASVGAVALLILTVLTAIRRSAPLWQRSPLDPALAFLLLSVALSAGWSPYPAVAAVATGLLLLLVLLAYGTTTATLTRTPGVLAGLLAAMGAGTVIAACWGVTAYFLSGRPAWTAGIGANAVGTTLATGFPVLLGLGVKAGGRVRIAVAAGAALTAIGLALTFARGAWLGGAAGLLLFVLLLPRRALRPVLLLLAILGAVGVLGLANAAGPLGQRAESFSDLGSVNDRVAMWRASLAMVRDRPLLGGGLNTFGLIYPRYRLPEDQAPGQPFAHNVLMNMAAEGGLLGLGALLAVILIGALLGVRWLRRAEDDERISAASVLAAATALMVHQLLDGTAISFHVGFGLWVLLGIMVARGLSPPLQWGTDHLQAGP